MTTRQIRIACDGFVISTRPFPEMIYEDELEQLRADIRFDVAFLRERGYRVVVYADEAGSNVVYHMRCPT